MAKTTTTPNNNLAEMAKAGIQQAAETKTVSKNVGEEIREHLNNAYAQSVVNLLRDSGITREKFVELAVTAVKKAPKLQTCDIKSLFGSILAAAELGLMPNTMHGHFYIIPYDNSQRDANGNWIKVTEATPQLGYQGMIEIMLRDGAVKSIDTELICENDHFVHRTKIVNGVKTEEFEFERNMKGGVAHENRGKRVGVWVTAELPNGNTKVKHFFKEDIDRVAMLSQGHKAAIKNNKPESSPYSEEKDPNGWMWRKFAIKQIFKELPKGGRIEKAMRLDDYGTMGGTIKNLNPETTSVIDDNVTKDAFDSVAETVPFEDLPNGDVVDTSTGEVKPSPEQKNLF